MNDVFEIGLLMDFYGQLLTERQMEILDLHYNNDYSFGEIAEELGISRQGVYDNIKRGKSILFEMEEKLGLLGKFSVQKRKAEEILELLKDINIDRLDIKGKDNIIRIKEGVEFIINKI
ncbi:MAG: YlxM family DNA-binding protein [Bacillota bacterium]|nr:YlxM family DNA-binding protein [Bacillota bacterium]